MKIKLVFTKQTPMKSINERQPSWSQQPLGSITMANWKY